MHNSPITIEALQVLDAIDQRGSFAAAAEQLNKVPSALSYIVQKLEEQLSVTLFVRQGRRSVLTPAGKHLLLEGRKLLGAVNKLTEETQTISHGWEPKIRIAFDTIIELNELLASIKQFLDAHPTIEIDLSEQVMNGSWEALIEDKVDLLVGAPAPVPNHKGIRAIKMNDIEQVLSVPSQHPLTTLDRPITEADIQHYRTVIVHDSAQQAVPWSSNVIERSQHFFVTSIAQKIKAITAGIGVGFLPVNRIKAELTSGAIKTLPFAGEKKTTEVYLAWKITNKGKGLATLREIIAG
ncbi:LysR substrate-binding domain-containing protein [Thalassotalea ganghwensis]